MSYISLNNLAENDLNYQETDVNNCVQNGNNFNISTALEKFLGL